MLRLARFALIFSLSATPALFAVDPPQKQDQNKSQTKEQKKNAEPARKEAPPTKDGTPESRLDRRNSRMTERNREVDGLVNKPKK